MVRSPFGDINIVTCFVYHDLNCYVFTDNGTGPQRKIFRINNCQLSNELRTAVIGLHSFTGNDYVSIFL